MDILKSLTKCTMPRQRKNTDSQNLQKKTDSPDKKDAKRLPDSERNTDSPSECMSDVEVKNYLIQNPDALEEFLLSLVSEERLEGLLQRKRHDQLVGLEHRLCNIQEKYLETSIESISIELIALDMQSEKHGTSLCENKINLRLNEAIHILAGAMRVDNFTLYIPIHNGDDLAVCRESKDGCLSLKYYSPIKEGTNIAAHAAVTKETIVFNNLSNKSPFWKSTGNGEGAHTRSVLCIPVVLPSDDVIGIFEFTKYGAGSSFSESDQQFANVILCWICACIHQVKLNTILTTQQKLNGFLLETTKVMFDEMTSIDLLVQNIMMYTKTLVHADRCALFLVDEEKRELYADYFDEGLLNIESGSHEFLKKPQIRFSQEKGIAGYVSNTAEIVNIHDAYADPRFNDSIDKMTGYRTKNILCMPIICKDKVIGVVQVINSLKHDHFTQGDESAFQMFAVYCALALHYSRMYIMMKEQQAKYKVALEVMQYHMPCAEEEMKGLLAKPLLDKKQIPADFKLYTFCCYDYEAILPELFVYMMKNMFANQSIELEKLCRFVLTVRKNYRPVAYHNWMHGFHVAHALWVMVASSPGVFTTMEKMALVVAGVCHDLDHRGYNNAFFQKLNLPLASLYSTSVMEQHHYKQTVTILQTENHNIFSSVSANEYKRLLELIREHIIATDLALYFSNQKTIAGHLKEGVFQPLDPAMKPRLTGLMMTGADLCSCCKPWNTQEKTVDYIYREFYEQGDEERRHGLEPIPMMDRQKRNEMPKQQVGFLNFICVPLYTTLTQCLPGTKPLLDGTIENKDNWQKVAEEQPAE